MKSLSRTLTILAVAAAFLAAARVDAHESRPAYLEIRPAAVDPVSQPGAETYAVVWKVPAKGDLRLRLDPRFPASCQATTPVSRYPTGDAFVDRWTLRCTETLVGATITIDGLEQTLTDVLVRVELAGGTAQTASVQPSAPWFTVSEAPAWNDVARTYLLLGVEHILGGIDHLLFVLALLLIVRGRQRPLGGIEGGFTQLALTVTAFTVAHSITLALATLGFVHVPSAPVEAVIALSILFLAAEIARARMGLGSGPGLTERYPWVVAFSFGLLHGFGFAGALAEVGLPESAIPLALLLFNVGVEVGQLLFVAVILAALAGLRRLELPRPAWSWQLATYAIGSVAAFWTVQRVAAFW